VQEPREALPNRYDPETKPTVYLGGNRYYHVYVHVPDDAAKAWPTATGDITGMLEVSMVESTGGPTAVAEPATDSSWSEAVEGMQVGGPAEKLSFGPVIERVINDDAVGKDIFIDLDTGRLLTPPPEFAPADERAGGEWIEANGVDAFCDSEGDLRGLVCLKTLVKPVRDEDWQRLKPQRVWQWADTRRGATEGPIAAAEAELPVTYLFSTSGGARGILQLLAFTEYPEGVKIRYKIVHPADEDAAWGPVSKGLQCRLLPLEQTVKVAEGTNPEQTEVYVTYELRNVGEEPLKILWQRMALPWEFAVTGPDGSKLVHHGLMPGLPHRQKRDFLAISPRQTLVRRVGLRYGFTQPGLYQVSLKTARNPAPDGRDIMWYYRDAEKAKQNPDNVWTGTLKSNTVTVNVVQKDLGRWGKAVEGVQENPREQTAEETGEDRVDWQQEIVERILGFPKTRCYAGSPWMTPIEKEVDLLPLLREHWEVPEPSDRARLLTLMVELASARAETGAEHYRITDMETAGVIVRALDDKDGDVHSRAVLFLLRHFDDSVIRGSSEEIVEKLRQKYTDAEAINSDAILLLGRTGSNEAASLLKDDERYRRSSELRAKLALAKLGDKDLEAEFIKRFEREDRDWMALADRLGYIGSEDACKALARELRTPEIVKGRGRLSARVFVIDALSKALPRESVFWSPKREPVDDSYYEEIEKWVTARWDITWEHPRPPFFYSAPEPIRY